MACVCWTARLDPFGRCACCDATLSSPPHVCLRWQRIIADEHGCLPTFARLHDDHETAWRLDRLDGTGQEGTGS